MFWFLVLVACRTQWFCFNYLLGQDSVIKGKSVLFSPSGCFIYCIPNERASHGAAPGASLAVGAPATQRAATPNNVPLTQNVSFYDTRDLIVNYVHLLGSH